MRKADAMRDQSCLEAMTARHPARRFSNVCGQIVGAQEFRVDLGDQHLVFLVPAIAPRVAFAWLAIALPMPPDRVGAEGRYKKRPDCSGLSDFIAVVAYQAATSWSADILPDLRSRISSKLTF